MTKPRGFWQTASVCDWKNQLSRRHPRAKQERSELLETRIHAVTWRQCAERLRPVLPDRRRRNRQLQRGLNPRAIPGKVDTGFRPELRQNKDLEWISDSMKS